MRDPFGREITYVRVSVTDRCDFRCVYCMSEDMVFRPKDEILSLEELARLCDLFVARGVRKIRLTGGEPLVRRDLMTLVAHLGRHLDGGGLDELVLTTNGSQLVRYARPLYDHGVRRLNVSLDTLDAGRFRAVTRGGKLDRVVEGIEAARTAGLAVKVNTVVQAGVNDDEIDTLLRWCGERECDLTLIETMPLGEIGGSRADRYLPLADVRARLERAWTLRDVPERTGGPARYVRVAETGRRLGFITPLSDHFCDRCNRVRLTCTGTLYMCLGQDDAVDLRAPLRAAPDNGLLEAAIDRAIAGKPRGHEFVATGGDVRDGADNPAGVRTLRRHMNVTGG